MIAHINHPQAFVWFAPVPVDPTAAEGARPVLTVHYDDGDEKVKLKTLVAAAPTVKAIVDRELTIDEGIDEPRAAGGWGAAFYRASTGDDIAISVADVDGTTVTLAASMSRPGRAAGGGVLWWAAWTAELESRAVATRARWTLTYTAHIGPGVTQQRTAEGIIRWVRQPFATGLTHEVFLRKRPDLVVSVPDQVGDTGPFIEAALVELALEVRAHMQQRGLTEHDIIGSPEGMADVHADLTAARILDLINAPQAEGLRARALGPASEQTGARMGGQLAMVLRQVFLDLEGSGALPAAATDVAVIRPAARVRSTMAEYVEPSSLARHGMAPTGFHRGEPH